MKTGLILIFAFLFGARYVACSDRTLNEIANKMSTEKSNEILHVTMNYRKIKREEISLAALKNSVRRELKTMNSQFLADTMCGGTSPQIKQRFKELSDLYLAANEYELIDDILHDAIKETLNCKTPYEIVEMLVNLHTVDERNSYELLVRYHIQLFDIFSKQPYMNDKKLMGQYTFSFYKTKNENLYKTLYAPLRVKIYWLITRLPTNIQYLFFHNHFCLMNSKYSEYLYTAMTSRNLDASSRYIWVWFEKWSIDDTGYTKANMIDLVAGNSSHLLVQLEGTKYQLYYYMVPETKLIAAWEMSTEPVNSIWKIEFIDNDRVAFYQNGYIMCSTEERTDQERRLLKGYAIGSYSAKSSECQWLLGSCNRKE